MEVLMCDEHTLKSDSEGVGVTRRQFSKMTTTTALAMTLPAVANAKTLTAQDVTIETADGVCDALFVRPSEGKHPAVLIWPDILALRPSFREMATRLAQSGYSVLCINPYYRDSKSPVVQVGESFQDEATRSKIMPMYRSLSPETHRTDASAFVAWLDEQPSVDTQRPMGTMGYCMGGPIVMRTAALRPDRIRAACAYHPVSLVSEDAESPHLLIPQMQGEFFIGLGLNDDERDPNEKVVLAKAFADSDLAADIEVYQDAMHGWCVLDSRAYQHEAAERAWSKTLALFSRALI
jgi:carboxymethylenebutenolidase